MKIETSKKDIVWNYIGTLFQMGVNYLLLPFFLIYLSDDVLGLWYIYMNLSTISTLFGFGFSPAFSRNIAYCWSGSCNLVKFGADNVFVSDNGDVDSTLFCTLIKTCKIVYLFVSIIVAIVMMTAGTLYIHHIASYLFENDSIKLSWIVFLIAMILNILYGYYIALLSGIGKIAERNIAIVVSSIIRIGLTGLLLALGLDILGACIAYLIYGISFRFICKAIFDRALLGREIKFFHIERHSVIECFKTIWPNSWRDGIVSISDYLCAQAGTVVASFFLPLSQIGYYSLYVQLITAISRIAKSYQNARIPSIQSAFIIGDKEDLKREHSMCVTAYILVFLCGVILLFAIGTHIITLIKPSIVIENKLLFFIAISQFITVLCYCYTSFLSATNRVDYWASFIVSSIISIILSVILLNYSNLGIWGIVLSSIIVEMLYNAWYWPNKVNKELQLTYIQTIKIGTVEILKHSLHNNDES